MTGIARTSEKLKKKISFEDYSRIEQTNASSARKIYSLSDEDTKMLMEIYSRRGKTANASSISEIMSEAIHLLYTREN